LPLAEEARDLVARIEPERRPRPRREQRVRAEHRVELIEVDQEEQQATELAPPPTG